MYIAVYFPAVLHQPLERSRILPEPPVSKRNEKSNKSDIRARLKKYKYMMSGLITYEYYNESAFIFFFIFRRVPYTTHTSLAFHRKLRLLVVLLIYDVPAEIIVTTINDSENLWHFYMSPMQLLYQLVTMYDNV